MLKDRITNLLNFLYPAEEARAARKKIDDLLAGFHAPAPAAPLTEKDALLITYGDTFRREGEPPLITLDSFLRAEAGAAFSGVHILPFYPSSSDDGFAVIDYRQVDPALGSWAEIARLGGQTRLMFDGVINHVSARSDWFQKFRLGQAPYKDYFITPEQDWDLSRVARPRTLPLLTEVETVQGVRQVWTTFSADQIDLNYANPAVLLEMISLILFYVEHGASLIRLDAIAYLWKEHGTTCLHLPQTHAVVKLLRAVLNQAAPWVQLVTETNVPHAENISYFGKTDPVTGRTDEAQMVYQFPLAPLVLDALHRENGEKLSRWAASLGGEGIFFNFLASHDGIGLMPARGILAENEVEELADLAIRHGGQVSYRSNPDGSHSPYELNITLYDAINDPSRPSPEDIPRFMAAQAVMFSLAGVPGVYVHSLFGSHNWLEGVRATGRARTINRALIDAAALQGRLADSNSREAQVFDACLRLLKVRGEQPAFHPLGAQKVIEAGKGVFALQREAPGGGGAILCLVNLTSGSQNLDLQAPGSSPVWKDLVGGSAYNTSRGRLSIDLKPYQAAWLAAG